MGWGLPYSGQYGGLGGGWAHLRPCGAHHDVREALRGAGIGEGLPEPGGGLKGRKGGGMEVSRATRARGRPPAVTCCITALSGSRSCSSTARSSGAAMLERGRFSRKLTL